MFVLCEKLSSNKKEGNQDKHQNERKKHQKPSDSGCSCTTNQIEYPSPKEDIDNFDNKNKGSIRNSAAHSTNTIFIDITNILIQDND